MLLLLGSSDEGWGELTSSTDSFSSLPPLSCRWKGIGRRGVTPTLTPLTISEDSGSIPLVSFNYKGLFWSSIIRGKSRKARVEEITRKAHGEGKEVRVYGVKNQEGEWGRVLDAGVDKVSVDELERFREFCKTRIRGGEGRRRKRKGG